MADGKVEQPKDNEVMFNMFGMERQGLHNTALVMVYHQGISKELKDHAERYLVNLLIAATNDLSKNWLT